MPDDIAALCIAASRDRLVKRIAKMIGRRTYNHAPINYTIAENAIAMAERHFKWVAKQMSNVVPIRKPVPEHGVLLFRCPKCGETLEVGLHITACDEPTNVSPVTGTHYGHPVDFMGQTPHLHATFWGHLVRCHQPNPHPYMGEVEHA